MEVLIGEKAPLFSLRDEAKNEVSLEQLRGKPVVLVFFPLAFSSVCTEELCIIRDDLKAFNDLDARVLAISVDSLYALKEFKQQKGYNFPLLSDFNKETSRSYGALHEEFAYGMKGVAKRSVFVIDPAGMIRYKEILDIPSEMPNFAKVKETLSAL